MAHAAIVRLLVGEFFTGAAVFLLLLIAIHVERGPTAPWIMWGYRTLALTSWSMVGFAGIGLMICTFLGIK